MFEQKLSGMNKAIYGLVGVLSVAMTIGFAIAAVMARHMPWQVPVAFVLGTLFAAAWAVLMFRTLRRGSINLRIDEKAQAGLGWVFVVFMITLFMLLAGRRPDYLGDVETH